MKKIISIIAVLALTNNVVAQDSLKISAGIGLAPQAGISFLTSKEGFKTFIPVTFIIPITKGKITVIPQYNFSSNSCAILISHDLKKFSAYIVASKSIVNKGGYVGLGLTRPVNSYSILFAEIGTGTHACNPALYLGALLPFTLKIK